MHIVSTVQGKGGVGKSTLAVNIARALQLRGLDVCIIDTDQQGTAQNWGASGDTEALPPVYAVTAHRSLQANVKHISKAFDVAVIDGGADLQEMHAAIVKTSDLVLIPIQPSPADIWPTETVVEMVNARKSITGRPEAAFVVSRKKAGTRLADAVHDALEHFNLPVWEGTHDRVAYAEAMGRGESVVESDNAKAAQEIETLTDHVIEVLTHE